MINHQEIQKPKSSADQVGQAALWLGLCLIALVIKAASVRFHISLEASAYWVLGSLALIIGIAGYYLASYLDLRGLQTVSVGLERIILYTYPVFVMILSTIYPGKKISLPFCICIAVI